jgi:hypothetical protein
MKPSMREIARCSAAYFGIEYDEIVAENRVQKFAWPRHIAMMLCREMSDRSTTDIGKFFSGRHHTTVLHAYQSVDLEAARDVETMRAVMAIAAEATGLSIDRQAREQEWVQDLHCGQPLVTVAPHEPIPLPAHLVKAVVGPAPPRRIMVVNGRGAPAARPRPVTMPSDIAAPSMARKMGARA